MTKYGTVTLNADATYSYTLNNTLPQVQALAPGETLTETFTYSWTDKDGDIDYGTLTITIRGTDDVPTVQSFTHTFTEDTGSHVLNGNALTNSTYGDGLEYGEYIAHQGYPITKTNHTFVPTGNQTSQYGTLVWETVNGQLTGKYSYTMDNGNPAVQALNTGQTLTETYTYEYRDKDGSTANGTLTIKINGTSNDGGVNFVIGNDSSETLTGTTGNDGMFGGKGDDVLIGGDGNDVLYGGDGNDVLVAGTTSHTYDAWVAMELAELNTLAVGDGNNVLDGGAGHDILIGGGGNDILVGGAGHDILVGGAGADTLYGDSGNDILIGGAGDDILYGGGGRNTFFWSLEDLGGTDHVLDFTAGNDKIVIEGITDAVGVIVNTNGTITGGDYTIAQSDGSIIITGDSEGGPGPVQTITFQDSAAAEAAMAQLVAEINASASS